MAGDAVALRFIPYSERSGHLNLGWAALMAGAAAARASPRASTWSTCSRSSSSRLRAWQLRREDPDTTEHEIDEQVQRELETGEFQSVAK